jgi:hypothetical protein
MTPRFGQLLALGRAPAPLTARGHLRRPATSIIVVTEGPSPSFDYYLAPRIAQSQLPVTTARLADDPAALLRVASSGALIIFCRYVTAAWIAALDDPRLAGAALFLDDDIAALIDDASVPLPYRLRLWQKHQRHVPALSRALDLLWVSTLALAARFPGAAPVVLPPQPGDADTPQARPASQVVRIAFHSTASHAAEHAWLAPVLARVAAAHPTVTFDVYMNWRTARFWRSVPNVTAHAPKAWPNYRADTRARGADLLLAPMLPSLVNAARAPTKRIDAYRLGAAMMTNAADIYLPTTDELATGLLVDLDREAWVAAIGQLVRDQERRTRLTAVNMRVVETWRTAWPLTLPLS